MDIEPHTAPQHDRQSGLQRFVRSLMGGRTKLLLSGCVGFSSVALAGTLAITSACSSDRSSAELAAPVAKADATAYEWRPVAIGGGGFITGFSADKTGATRVARTDVYGAYLWDARADRWVQLVTSTNMPAADREPMRLNTGVYEVTVAPSDPKRIYMAVAGDVFRSSDGGESFVKTSLPHTRVDANSPYRHYGSHIAIHPTNPDLVLYGTPADGLWRSENGGVDWSRISTMPAPKWEGSDPARAAPGVIVWFTPDGGRVWAMAAGSRMMTSTDGGKTFASLAGGPSSLRQGSFAANGVFYGVDSVDKKVWKFADGAWSDLTLNPGIRAASFASVALEPESGAVYVFDEGGRGFRSGDGGGHWSRLASRAVVGDKEPPWLRVVDNGYFATSVVAFDPVIPNRLWNAAGTGMYFADVTDAGERVTWTSQVRGIEELVANDVVAPPGQLPLFAGWDFGVHVRDDLRKFSTGYGPKRRVLIAVQQVDWSASNPAFLVTNASDTLRCCSEDGDTILAGFSEDGGRTWSKFAALPHPPGTEASDPWRMSYGTIAVSANDVNNIVWMPAANRSAFYTKDRGVTWSRVSLPGEVLPYTGSYANYFYHRRTLAADRVLPATFYLYHGGEGDNSALTGLWKTSDGGAHWGRVWEGEIAPSSQASAKVRVVPGHAGHLFFTSDIAVAGPDTVLRRSRDGGKSWTKVEGVDRVHDVAFGKSAPGHSYPAIYVAGWVQGVYGIWRSVDEAATWVRVGQFPVGALDEVVAMDADKDVFGRIYLGFKGSGWRYGQPSECRAAPYLFRHDSECFGLRHQAR